MPDYSRLHVPQALTYCKNPVLAKQELGKILQSALAGRHSDYAQHFDYLQLNIEGLARCADYWVFVVRFFVISRDLRRATQYMAAALENEAQPYQLVLQTQQSLNQLISRLNQQEAAARQISVQPELSQISAKTFFQASRTVMQKQPAAVRWSDQQCQLYQREHDRINQPHYQQQMRTPTPLGRLGQRQEDV